MNDSFNSRFLDDPEFQSLLVACFESLQRGETIDRDALAKDFPKYVEEINQFLEDRQLLERVAAELEEVNPSDLAIDAYENTVGSAEPGNFELNEKIRYIGEYEILTEIARGGMGIVFKAKQQSLNRIVALKMILAGKLADTTDVERFRREARAAGRLRHSNIVPVHEIGEHEGRHYLTMDFVKGKSLSEIIRNETLAPRKAALVVRATAVAVQYAHQQGIVHRDLKPANVLLDQDFQPHITDFGLARMLESVDEESRAELTASGQILGTPSYMSPEQASGKQDLVGPASDIYSLGAILYACLTGRAPFVADSPVDTLFQVLKKDPVSPRDLNPSVPKDLETVCLKCLTKEPHKRYGTAQELADDLNRFLEGRPVIARPVSATSKVMRWGKRNPTIAALLVLSFLLLVTGTTVSTYFAFEAEERADAEESQRRRADHTVDLLRIANNETKRALVNETRALADMQAERDEAQRQRTRVEALLYVTHLKSAKDDLNANRVKEAREHLDSCRADVRGWEHDYLSAVVSNHENGEVQQPGTANPLIRPLSEELQQAEQIVIDPTGTHAVAIIGTIDGRPNTEIPIIEVKRGEVVGRLHGHESRPSTAAWSSDGARIVTGADDGSIRVWDAKTYEKRLDLPKHRSRVTTLAFSSDGHKIVGGSGNARIPLDPYASLKGGELIVYDADAGNILWNLRGHVGALTCTAFSPDGNWIASGGFGGGVADSGEVRIWSAKTGELVRAADGQQIAVTSVAFSSDSTQLAVAGGLGPGKKDVLVWNVASGETVMTLSDHRQVVMSVSFSPDGSRIATVGGDQLPSTDRQIKFWDSATGVELLELDGGENFVLKHPQVVWAAGNRKIIGAGHSNGRSAFISWNAGQLKVLPQLVIRRGTASAVTSLKFTSDGQKIVGGGLYQNVRVWDVQSGEELQTVTRHTKPIMAVDATADGSRIASASFDGLKVWDQKLNREILSIDALGDELNYHAVACSPDGQRIAGGASRGRAWVWEVSGNLRGQLSTLQGHQGTVKGVAFSADGQRVATAGSDRTVRIWRAQTGEAISLLEGHTSVVTCVAFSPNGTRVVSGSFDKTLKVWDADNAEIVASLEGHTTSVLCAAFSPDGKYIASGSGDRTIRLWNAETGELLATLTGHEFYVRSVAFSPDGSLIASSAGPEDMTIRVWPNPLSR